MNQEGHVTGVTPGAVDVIAAVGYVEETIRLPVLPGYVLPFRPGESYRVSQGWNGSFSHSKAQNRYAIDFTMPPGTPVIAARAGRVILAINHHPDGTFTAGQENLVIIDHLDGTFAIYSHLTTSGTQVTAGQNVQPGDPVGLSGNSGFSTRSHLHFHVAVYAQPGCPSVKSYVINAEPAYPFPNSLETETMYLAQPVQAPPF